MACSDGEVTFASIPGSSVGRGAITVGPDGTSWLGISSVNTIAPQRRKGHARALCSALKQWGAENSAQRAYVQVAPDNAAAVSLYESLGFRLHHHYRYFDARSFITRTL
jgi:RimJ/RimL family protein N-acetyltransferase